MTADRETEGQSGLSSHTTPPTTHTRLFLTGVGGALSASAAPESLERLYTLQVELSQTANLLPVLRRSGAVLKAVETEVGP